MAEANTKQENLLNTPFFTSQRQERDAARELREQKREGSGMKTAAGGATGAAIGSAVPGVGTLAGRFIGSKLGAKLARAREKAKDKQGEQEGKDPSFAEATEDKEEGFDGPIFYIILILSMFKDGLDWVNILLSAGSGGLFYVMGTFLLWIASIITSIFLVMFFWIKFRTGRMFTKMIKAFIWPTVMELIPFVRLFPFYTIMTVLLKLKESRKTKKLFKKAEQMISG
jgi:hypothetical protein